MKNPVSPLAHLGAAPDTADRAIVGETPHLSEFDLELLDLGDEMDSQASLHLESCARCRGALEGLEAERRALLARKPPSALIQEMATKAALPRKRVLREARPWGALAAAAFVALSALWLWLVPGPSEDADSLLVVSVGGASQRIAELAESGFVLKGNIAPLSVIRQRGKDQSVFEGTVSVVPGDLLRVRFHRQAQGRVVGGVVTDEGEWSELFSGHYAAGTHAPLATLRVTGDPGGGLVLVGAEEAVERERALGEPQAGVARMQIEWTPGRDAQQ